MPSPSPKRAKSSAKASKAVSKTTLASRKKTTPVKAKPAKSVKQTPEFSKIVSGGATPERRFVLLPEHGLKAVGAGSQRGFLEMSQSLHREISGAAVPFTRPYISVPLPPMRLIDEINENKAKLIELNPDDITALRMQLPGIRIVPEVFYQLQPSVRVAVQHRVANATARTAITIHVRSNQGGPVPGAFVIAFTDFAQQTGASGTTNASGIVKLALGGTSSSIERLYIYPHSGHWGLLKKNFILSANDQFTLTAIQFPFTDSLDAIYGQGAPGDGLGVKVAVLDTGSGPHPDLVIAGGENTVVGEDALDYGDNGDQHGTHVAGIIAARGMAPTGRSGVAPGVSIYSYRVFAKGQSASNFAIAKAIDRAAQNGCHLINMSLGGGTPDPVISSAIADARYAGAVAIVASGNDGRQPVAFPASDSRALAVSAMGRKGTFPATAVESGDVMGPFGNNPKDFIAAFSNIGAQISLTGPGVGVISTVPGGYAVMSGTSMACPAVTGLAARMLAKSPAILNMPANQTRSDKIIQQLLASAVSLGFPANMEGRGLPQ